MNRIHIQFLTFRYNSEFFRRPLVIPNRKVKYHNGIVMTFVEAIAQGKLPNIRSEKDYKSEAKDCGNIVTY